MYQSKRLADAAHQMVDNGIAVKKIDRDYTASKNARAKTEYQERVEKTEAIAIVEPKCSKTERDLHMIELRQIVELKSHNNSRHKE